jgi:hypothetical protein
MKTNTPKTTPSKKPANTNKTPTDYKDPTGSKTPIGHPKKNSGYDEKQPR